MTVRPEKRASSHPEPNAATAGWRALLRANIQSKDRCLGRAVTSHRDALGMGVLFRAPNLA